MINPQGFYIYVWVPPALHIPDLRALIPRLYYPSLSIPQMKDHLPEKRRADSIKRSPRAYRVDPHRTQHIPTGHRSQVVIPRQSARGGGEAFIHDRSYPILCPVRPAGIVKKIGNMKDRLIITNNRLIRERRIQPGRKSLPSTHQVDQVLHILACKKRINPFIAFFIGGRAGLQVELAPVTG